MDNWENWLRKRLGFEYQWQVLFPKRFIFQALGEWSKDSERKLEKTLIDKAYQRFEVPENIEIPEIGILLTKGFGWEFSKEFLQDVANEAAKSLN